MKSIAVIFGGQSAEHDVSIITAHIPIIDALEALGGYDVWPIYIDQTGRWYSDKQLNKISFFQQPSFHDELKAGWQPDLHFDNGLQLVWPGFRRKSQQIDVAFPAMHGTNGEDGSLIGLLRLANIPFVGCDVAASAVAMDKVLTKQVLRSEAIPVVKDVWFERAEWQQHSADLLKQCSNLQWPLFVKPAHLGSSIGITKAKTDTELQNAIEVALHYDDKVLVEEAVEPLIEITLPILGNHELKLAELERPLNKTEFFDFEDKYLAGGKGQGVNSQYSQIPAELTAKLAERVKEFGRQTYHTLGCNGIARIDFLINKKTQEVFVNEVNTLPGSLYHHNWRQAGLTSAELVTQLIALAEERFRERKQSNVAFNSTILQKTFGPKLQK